jgi:hypothetical protein
LSPLEGQLVNLLRGMAPRVLSSALVALTLAAIALTGASPAHASAASQIVEKCAKGEPFGGYSQQAYREALKQLPTEVIEYSACSNEIGKDALTASKGGGGSAAAEAASSNVPLPLSPSEQRAVQSAHHNGSTPVQVGSQPIRPGVVHADIASAVNTLPDSLLAMLAFLLVGALVLAAGEVAKRVRARRHG